MRSFFAFWKKEMLAQLRSGKAMFLGILFLVFGIMNPAVAKLTPWLLEVMSDSLAASGMTVTEVSISAMDSWVQFFKNIPMALIAFLLLEGSLFTQEYHTGTLILSLTKGLQRYKVVLSKSAVLIGFWSAGYWLCFGITYGYNAYFWDNSIVQNLPLSVVCWWLFGIWTTSLMMLFSTLCSSSAGVSLGTGGVVLAVYLLGLFPQLQDYMPTHLTEATALIYAAAGAGSYIPALLITLAVSVVCFAAAIPIFNNRRL